MTFTSSYADIVAAGVRRAGIFIIRAGALAPEA